MSAARRLLRAAPLAALGLTACGGEAGEAARTAGAPAADAARPAAEREAAVRPAAVQSPAVGGVDGTSQPARGSPQRAALMDALRPAIERELGGPIEFVVNRAAVQDGWALVIADPQRPDGGRIEPPPGFDMEFRDGLTVNGILRFSGSGWTLVDHAIGPTDVWYCGVAGPPAALTDC